MSGVELVEVRAEDADQRLDRWLRVGIIPAFSWVIGQLGSKRFYFA